MYNCCKPIKIPLNRYVNWDQKKFGIKDEVTQFYLGNMYATYWPTIENVCDAQFNNILNTFAYANMQTGTELYNSKLSRIVYQHICFS